MPAPFGFSVGDFFALTQLIFKVSNALNDSTGSKAEYQGLVQTLLSLLQTINAAEEMALRCSLDSTASRDAAILAPLNAIAREREICHKLIEDFMEKSKNYTASFIHGSGRAKAIKKITWCLFHSDDVQNVEQKLRVHTDAIHFYTCALGFQSLNASLTSNALVLTRIDKRTTMIYDMINQIFTMMPKALGYPWEGGFGPDEKPLRLLDALGRDLRIPAMFLSSRQIFHDTLEILHRGLPGHQKIILNEYTIADEDTEGRVIDPAIDLEWRKSVRPGKAVSLEMIFQTFLHNKSSETCPRCKSITSGPTLEGKRRRCHMCQLTFRIFEEVRVEEHKEPSKQSSHSEALKPSESKRKTMEDSQRKRRQTRAAAKASEKREQDIFRRIHYIHEIVKRRASDVSAVQQPQKLSDEGVYIKDLPPLHMAAAFGDLKAVKHLLDSNFNIESQGGCDSATPLHYAAYQGCQDVAIFLIQRGAKIESRDCDGATPLHWSIPFGHLSMFKLLLESGANITCRTNRGRTPLHWCAWEGQQTIAKFILEEDVDIEELAEEGVTPLLNICGHSSDVVRILVQEGADINARSRSLLTPLHCAAMYCSVETIHTLLELGADTNAVDDSGRTPLHVSIERGDAGSCRQLLEFGADVNAHDQNGNTGLHFAATLGSARIARDLLEFGAEITQNDDEDTPLHRILSETPEEVVRLLAAYGADVNATNLKGCTPLHQAAEFGNAACLTALIELGADIHAVDELDMCPIHVAAVMGQLSACQTLLEAGASVDEPLFVENGVLTPLHLAAAHNRSEVVAFLLEQGANALAVDDLSTTPLAYAGRKVAVESARVLLADETAAEQITHKTSSGMTPLTLAAREGHLEIVKMLIQHLMNQMPGIIDYISEYVQNDEFRKDLTQLVPELHGSSSTG